MMENFSKFDECDSSKFSIFLLRMKPTISSYIACQKFCACSIHQDFSSSNCCAIQCNLHIVPGLLCSRGVPIYRIGNISTADMAKFSISGIGIF